MRLSYNLGLEIKNWLLVTPRPCWISKSLSLESAWYLSESSIPSQHFLPCPPPAFSGTSKGNLHDFFSFHHLQRHFFPHLWRLKKPNSPLALIHNVLEPSLTYQLSRSFPREDNSHTPPPRNMVAPGHTEHSNLSYSGKASSPSKLPTSHSLWMPSCKLCNRRPEMACRKLATWSCKTWWDSDLYMTWICERFLQLDGYSYWSLQCHW